MSAIKIIFEYLGGETVTNIFRNFWMILLIIKQVMFSLFSAEMVTLPENTDAIFISTVDPVHKEEKNIFGLDAFQVVFTLSSLNKDN